ncbi:hypothetical protein Vafri_8098, partial [Volvox africanus]
MLRAISARGGRAGSAAASGRPTAIPGNSVAPHPLSPLPPPPPPPTAASLNIYPPQQQQQLLPTSAPSAATPFGAAPGAAAAAAAAAEGPGPAGGAVPGAALKLGSWGIDPAAAAATDAATDAAADAGDEAVGHHHWRMDETEPTASSSMAAELREALEELRDSPLHERMLEEVAEAVALEEDLHSCWRRLAAVLRACSLMCGDCLPENLDLCRSQFRQITQLDKEARELQGRLEMVHQDIRELQELSKSGIAVMLTMGSELILRASHQLALSLSIRPKPKPATATVNDPDGANSRPSSSHRSGTPGEGEGEGEGEADGEGDLEGEASASLPPPPLPPWPLPWPSAPVGESPVAVPLPSVSVLRSRAASRGRPASPPTLELELELDATTADPPPDDPTTYPAPDDQADAASPVPLPVLTPAPARAQAPDLTVESPEAVELYPPILGSEVNPSAAPLPAPPSAVLTAESNPKYELVDTPPRVPSPEPSPSADAAPPNPLLQIASPNPSPSPSPYPQDTVSVSAELPPAAAQATACTSDGPSQDASDGRGSPSCTIPNPAVQNPHVILPPAPEPTDSDSPNASIWVAAALPQREAEPEEVLDAATAATATDDSPATEAPPATLAPEGDASPYPPAAPSAADEAAATSLESDPAVTAEGASSHPSVRERQPQ